MGLGFNTFMMLQLKILISYVAGPFSLDATRGECIQELDGAWGGHQSFEVLKCGGFHLIFIEVVVVGGSEDKKVNFISIRMTTG